MKISINSVWNIAYKVANMATARSFVIMSYQYNEDETVGLLSSKFFPKRRSVLNLFTFLLNSLKTNYEAIMSKINK
jgi:hypothetical protein